MARARSIKPGFFHDVGLTGLPPLARLLFAGLWCYADRAGRLADNVRQIKHDILPDDRCDVGKLLDLLASADPPFIIRYEHDARRYIQIRTWDKHQNPHIKEAASTIPAPCSHGAEPGNSGTSRASSFNPLPLTLNPEPETAPRREDATAGYPDIFGGQEPLTWLESVFTGEWIADTWRAFARYVNTPELAKALRDNTPLWMSTRKWREGFGTNSVKYLSGGIWHKPPNGSLMAKEEPLSDPPLKEFRSIAEWQADQARQVAEQRAYAEAYEARKRREAAS